MVTVPGGAPVRLLPDATRTSPLGPLPEPPPTLPDWISTPPLVPFGLFAVCTVRLPPTVVATRLLPLYPSVVPLSVSAELPTECVPVNFAIVFAVPLTAPLRLACAALSPA